MQVGLYGLVIWLYCYMTNTNNKLETYRILWATGHSNAKH